MQRPTLRRFIGSSRFLALIGLCVSTTPGAAQMPYAAANGQTSILPTRHSFFSVDFAEAEVALTFLTNLPLGCGEADCDMLNLALYTTAAARKGQRDLFTRLDFVPGFDVGGASPTLLRNPTVGTTRSSSVARSRAMSGTSSGSTR